MGKDSEIEIEGEMEKKNRIPQILPQIRKSEKTHRKGAKSDAHQSGKGGQSEKTREQMK